MLLGGDFMSDNQQVEYLQSYSGDYKATDHNHAFLTIADVAREHQHGIVGTTGPAIYHADSHFHRICVKTTYDPKGGTTHWHEVDIKTGPALELRNGEHTHAYCGQTSVELGHCHTFSSVTDTSPNDHKC
jgi:hypothetical protein